MFLNLSLRNCVHAPVLLYMVDSEHIIYQDTSLKIRAKAMDYTFRSAEYFSTANTTLWDLKNTPKFFYHKFYFSTTDFDRN